MAQMGICRLCSTTEQIFDVFHPHLNNGEQLRFSILLATGIQIKETDLVSKMVCHRCCEIALKLCKYRTNAVANDKLLKEKAGQPYTAPIVEKDELFLAASRILCNAKCRDDDSLQLLDLLVKREVTHQPCDNIVTTQLLQNIPCSLPSTDFANVDGVQAPDQSLTNIPTAIVKTADERTDKDLAGTASINTAENLSSVSSNIAETVDHSNVSPALYNNIPKVKYKHPSVQKLSNLYTNIILPENISKSDVSPVVSLDIEEVSNWYTEQILHTLEKIPSCINIKKVLHDSNNSPSHDANNSSLPLSLPKNSAISSSKHGAICEDNIRISSKKLKVQRKRRRYIDSSDSDSDNINNEKYLPVNNHENEDHISKIRSAQNGIPLISQKESVPSTSLNLNDENTKKSNTYVRRKSACLDKDDVSDSVQKKEILNQNTVSTNDFPRPCNGNKDSTLASPLKAVAVHDTPSANGIADTFLCRTCNKLYDTKIELLTHEKVHLRCRYCKKKKESVESLNKHQDETCFVKIMNSQPCIALTKVDSMQSVVKKYANAFREPDEQKSTTPTVPLNSNEFIDYSELGLNMEKPKYPVASTELFMELEESIANQYFTLLEDFEKNSSNSGEALINENIQESDVICISDGSDNEADLISANTTVSVPPQKLDNPPLSTSRQPYKPKIDSNLSTQSNLGQREIIQTMFKKHFRKSSKTCENSSQTFVNRERSIRCVGTNDHIKLCNLFCELFGYRIPVHLISQPNINVELKSLPGSTPTTNYSWAHKKCIDLEKEPITLNQLLMNNNNPAVNNPPTQINTVLHSMLQSSPNYKPDESNLLNKLLSTATTGYSAQAPPLYNFNFNSVFRENPYSKELQKQPTEAKQTVVLPNTNPVASSSCQKSSSVNQSPAISEPNQDNFFYEQPDQIFYNNQHVNVNNYFMFSNDIQQTQQQAVDVSNMISYSNNVDTLVLPSHKHIQNYNHTTSTSNQTIKLVPPTPNARVVDIPSNMLRVKPIQELS